MNKETQSIINSLETTLHRLVFSLLPSSYIVHRTNSQIKECEKINLSLKYESVNQQ